MTAWAVTDEDPAGPGPSGPPGRGASPLTTYGGGAVPVDPGDPLLDTAVRRVAAGAGEDRPFGRPGRPLAERTPLRVGFSAALGVGLAVVLLLAVAEARGVLLLVATATALAVGLDPAVRTVQATGLPRAWSVAAVSLGLLLGVGGALLALVPPVVDQTGQFVGALPGYLDRLEDNPRVAELEGEFGVVERAQDYLTSNDLGQQALGGVVGAGRLVLGVLASVLTVLVLTVYLLASLPTLKQTAYRLVPRSRRPRVGLLADEILRRVGGYVAGQLAVALTAGTAALVWLLVLDVPFAGRARARRGARRARAAGRRERGRGRGLGGRPRVHLGGSGARDPALLPRLPADRELLPVPARHAPDGQGLPGRDGRGGPARRNPARRPRRAARAPGHRGGAARRRGGRLPAPGPLVGPPGGAPRCRWVQGWDRRPAGSRTAGSQRRPARRRDETPVPTAPLPDDPRKPAAPTEAPPLDPDTPVPDSPAPLMPDTPDLPPAPQEPSPEPAEEPAEEPAPA